MARSADEVRSLSAGSVPDAAGQPVRARVELPAFVKSIAGPDEPQAPLWSQVKSALAAVIARDGLAEHARLPSEARLCAHFGVSRTVVRGGDEPTRRERLIYKRQGKGAFVAAATGPAEISSAPVVGFSGELIDKQRQLTRQILRPGSHSR
jgi:DNA-binding GntR family transcriptional regulator